MLALVGGSLADDHEVRLELMNTSLGCLAAVVGGHEQAQSELAIKATYPWLGRLIPGWRQNFVRLIPVSMYLTRDMSG